MKGILYNTPPPCTAQQARHLNPKFNPNPNYTWVNYMILLLLNVSKFVFLCIRVSSRLSQQTQALSLHQSKINKSGGSSPCLSCII